MFKKDIVDLLAKTLAKNAKEIEGLIEVPPNSALGDYAFPCFSLAKDKKKSPQLIAQELAQELKPGISLAKIVAQGPYLNFFINKEHIAEQVLTTIIQEKNYGHKKPEKKTIIVEYPAPNTNKPLHLGHIRNMLLGESIARIFEYLGYSVKRVDLVNDRGIHICKSMLAYQHWGNEKKPDKKSDHFVGEFYVLYAKNESTALEEEARKLLIKWETGDQETIALWKKMNSWALAGFDETYKKFGITHEKTYFESDIYQKGKEIVYDGLKKGIFEKDKEANIVCRLEKYGLPDKVLLRGDGTSVYMTMDLYLAMQKYADFHFDSSVHVVGNEQILHFKQLFKIFELLRFAPAKNCYHLSYGMVYLPEGRMKSREGNVVDADDLVTEVVKEAESEILKRHKLTKKELQKRAEIIGMGGIKFHILRYDAQKDFTFNPEESIAFEGETGPYVQYTHARIASILAKAKKKDFKKVAFASLSLDQEKNLIRFLMDFPGIVEDAGRQYKPSLISRFLLEICQEFNNYYHHVPILKADVKTRNARLLLIACIQKVIAQGLFLLGIEAPEKM
jgi:arginyl-tRNA synthetase